MKLSIVCPVHNDSKNLEGCMKHLLDNERGSFDEIEVVVVDDGSTDDLGGIYDRLVRTHLKIFWKLIRLEENKGRFIARLEGAKNASYPTLLIIDARAWVAKDFLKTLSGLGYQPVFPWVLTKHDSWVGRVMFLLRKRLYKKTQSELSRNGEVTLTLDNYETHGKGTTAIFIDRKLFLSACERVKYTDKISHEESWLLKEILRQKPIKIVRDLVVTYNQRASLPEECVHLFHRGPRFVQYYINPGTRFFYHLMLVFAMPIISAGLFLFAPWMLEPTAIAAASAAVLSAIYLAEVPSDIPKALFVLVPAALSYTAGIYWGVAVAISGKLRGD
jgi:glycosyltransferase involved in cell wall biosynthesis